MTCIDICIKINMMSGSKAPDFDAYGLLRATHSHPGIINMVRIIHYFPIKRKLFFKNADICKMRILHEICGSVIINYKLILRGKKYDK